MAAVSTKGRATLGGGGYPGVLGSKFTACGSGRIKPGHEVRGSIGTILPRSSPTVHREISQPIAFGYTVLNETLQQQDPTLQALDCSQGKEYRSGSNCAAAGFLAWDFMRLDPLILGPAD